MAAVEASGQGPAPSLEGQLVPEHFKSLCKATHSFSSVERCAVHRAAEISKEVMKSTVTRLVQQSAGQPMMRSASSDGTTVRLQKRLEFMAPASGKERRSGGETQGFLVSHEFF